jgi:XRE family transcriptional regulator, regulator of sulfur utilization
MKLGQSIKKLRVNKARQIQGLFAQNIGITQSYLSQIETGQKEPSTEILQKIADYFEVPLPILFWYGIEESDIKPEKAEYYKVLKPAIDSLIGCFL